MATPVDLSLSQKDLELRFPLDKEALGIREKGLVSLFGLGN